MGFVETDQSLVRLAFVQYWRKNGKKMRQYINNSWTTKKPMIQLERKHCIICIFVESYEPMKLERKIK
jgi:hypothetical protein